MSSSENAPELKMAGWSEVGEGKGKRGVGLSARLGKAGFILPVRLHLEFCNLQLNCRIQKYFWQMVFHNHSSSSCTISFA